MTTAARPTFDSARGGQGARERDLSALSKQYSSRDLPSQMSLKTRDRGQSNPDDLSGRDFRRELEDRERAAAAAVAAAKRPGGAPAISMSDRDRDSRGRLQLESSTSSAKKSRPDPANIDADDPLDESDSDDDSDSDDEAALMAELKKIKEEKAMEMREKEEEQRAEDERIRMENILTGNPLLKDRYAAGAGKSDMRVKRRWDDDVVFKNCSRAEPDKSERTFINDSLRSEFHKKFMDKYIK